MNINNDPLVLRADARREYFGGVHRGTLARWEAEGRVPPRIVISKTIVGWRKSTLEQWLASKESAGVK